MSVFRRIFGVKNKKDKRRTNMATVDTILKLQETENFLIMKLALLEKKIEQEIGIAKKNITNKRGTVLNSYKIFQNKIVFKFNMIQK